MKNESCLIISTPYHVLNAANLLESGAIGPARDCDLYFSEDFANWATLFDKFTSHFSFSATSTFRRAFPLTGGPLGKLEAAIGTLLPKAYVERMSHQNGPKITAGDYSTIYSGWYNYFTISCVLSNPLSEIVLFDDGLGSYIESDIDILAKRRKLCSIAGRTFPSFTPSRIYLNSPECCCRNDYQEIRRIPQPEYDQDECFLYDLFSFVKQPQYTERKVVYLTRPRWEGRTDDVTSAVEKILQRWDDGVICRLHPREKHPESYEFDCVDNSVNLWELLCARQITNNHILVGCLSTAQFTPKLLAGIEPWIVFTQNLYRKSEAEAVRMAELAETLRWIYVQPEKVITVNSLEELSTNMAQLIHS